MPHNLVKLKRVALHLVRDKGPLNFRPQQAQSAAHPQLHRLTIHSDGRQCNLRSVMKSAIGQRAAHFLCFSFTCICICGSLCKVFSAVSTDARTTFSPRYTRSTPAREITSVPW